VNGIELVFISLRAAAGWYPSIVCCIGCQARHWSLSGEAWTGTEGEQINSDL